MIVGVVVKEGLEAWRGEGCSVSSPLARTAASPNAWGLEDSLGRMRQLGLTD